MSGAVDREIGELLRAAEEGESCLVPGGPEKGRVRRALSRRVARGEVVSPARGLFADAEVWAGLTTSQRTLRIAHGLQALHPGWVFCGPTAAVAYGLDVSDELLGTVHVASTPRSRDKSGAVATHHAILAGDGSDEVVAVRGLRLTSPLRTVFDCLRWAGFPHGLGIADSALREGLVSIHETWEYVRRVPGRPHGRDHALRTLMWADPRSESGGESIARARMILLGFVCPELQVEIPDPLGSGVRYRADFTWVRADGVVILGELDGRRKYYDPAMTRGRDVVDVLADERLRESRIGLYDVSVMRFSFRDTEDPARFSALLERYGVPRRGSELAPPEGVPMVPDWKALRRS